MVPTGYRTSSRTATTPHLDPMEGLDPSLGSRDHWYGQPWFQQGTGPLPGLPQPLIWIQWKAWTPPLDPGTTGMVSHGSNRVQDLFQDCHNPSFGSNGRPGPLPWIQGPLVWSAMVPTGYRTSSRTATTPH